MRRAVHLLGKAFRETGQAMDRLGLTVAENEIYRETYSRHRNVMNLFDKVSFAENTSVNLAFFFQQRERDDLYLALWGVIFCYCV
jgi:hypothetical protein